MASGSEPLGVRDEDADLVRWLVDQTLQMSGRPSAQSSSIPASSTPAHAAIASWAPWLR